MRNQQRTGYSPKYFSGSVAMALALTAGGLAVAQQPPDVVTSDGYGDTAMGYGVLTNLQPKGGGANTAAGWDASLFNTTGTSNTALGFWALLTNKTGSYNTALGTDALNNFLGGSNNTAVGMDALGGLTTTTVESPTGGNNTAVGAYALAWSTSTSDNTAVGYYAMSGYSTGAPTPGVSGSGNTAVGEYSLEDLTSGSYNNAFGQYALQSNTSGSSNTALSQHALSSNTTGYWNTASGNQALNHNVNGYSNTAYGVYALTNNTGPTEGNSVAGSYNTASGVYALYANTTGYSNTAMGYNALNSNVSGSYNVAVGYKAGTNATGNDNIYINNQGQAADSQTMRLGTEGTSGVVGSGVLTTYIAGIYGVPVSGATPVYINSSGQLGTTPASSARFKAHITPMGSASARIAELKPVTFVYKSDATGTLQYGLIAEEVAKVYPELVIRGADGQINGIRYEELSPLLLNELQRQRRLMQEQQAEIADLKTQMAQMNKFTQSVTQALNDAQSRNALLAQGRPQ